MYAGVLYFDRNNVSSPKCENYKILDKGYAYFDPKLPYVTLLIENDEEDIRYNYENEDKFIIGDSVNICIKKGALGFEYAYIYQ